MSPQVSRRQALYAGAGVAAAAVAGGTGWLWTSSAARAAGTVLWRTPAHPDWGLIAGGGVVYVLGGRLSAVSGRSGKPLWRARPAGFSGAAGSGVVIIGTRQATAVSADAASYTAYRAGDGRVLWTYNGDGQHEIGGFAYGGGASYFADQQAGLIALDPATGQLKWQASARSWYPFAVTGGIVLLMPGASRSGHVLRALSAGSGRPAWQRELTGKPLLAATSGQGFLVACADGALYAIAAGTGQVRWRYRLPSPPAGLAADPASDMAYAADSTGTMYAWQV